MIRLVKTLAAVTVAMAALPANAQDWGDTASGSMSITVVIAPFGAAIAAQEEGAVGAWSVRGSNDGVLLGAPALLRASDSEKISLFNNANAPLSLTSLNKDVMIASLSNADFRGLQRQDFSIDVKSLRSPDPVTIIVGSI